MSWRSQRIKRAVASTVAAETLALSAATAEAQWLPVLWRDAVFGDVENPGWHSSASPFTIVLARDCKLSEAASGLAIVDAKWVFDALSRNSAVSKADRRNSIELAVVRDSLSAMDRRSGGCCVRVCRQTLDKTCVEPRCL